MNDPAGLGGRCSSQGSKFHRREFPPFSDRQPFQLQRAKSNPAQLLDRMPEAFHQSSDLAVSTFAKFDVETSSIPVTTQHGDPRLRGTGGRPFLSITEIQPIAEPLDLFLLHPASDADVVALVDFVARMGQSVRQFPIVRQKKQPRTIDIEPTDGKEPHAGRMIDKVERPFSSLRIAGRADKAPRLEQHDVIVPTRFLNPPPMHLDVVRLRDDKTGESLYHSSVDAHRSFLDEGLASAARGDPRFGEYSLNSDLGVGFRVLWGAWCWHSDHSTEVTDFERPPARSLALDPRCRTPQC